MSGPPLWVVERGSSNVYLFADGPRGVKAGDQWFVDPQRRAFEMSREFWSEVPDIQLADSSLLAQYGLSTEPLSARLEPAALRRLHQTAATVHVDPVTLEGLRPWLAAQVLEHALRAEGNVDAALAVDAVLTGLARSTDKTVSFEFPDADATLSSFANFSPSVEIDYLMWTVDRVAEGVPQMDRHVNAWMAGDLSVAEGEVAHTQEEYPSLHDPLIRDRNYRWLPRIEAMLSNSGSVFVLVGMAHLVGNDGLPALLAHHGIEATRLN